MSVPTNVRTQPRPNPFHVPVSKFFSEKKASDHNHNGPLPRAPTAPASMRPVSPPALLRQPNYPGPEPPRNTKSIVEDDSDIFGLISGARNRRSPLARSAVGDKQRPGDLSHHSSTDSLRRQLNVDDASSNASTSSRASRAKNVCRSCKQEGLQVRPLVSCTTCTRRYHEYCGDPKPINVAKGEDFICGRCREKPMRDEIRFRPPTANSEADGTIEVVASPSSLKAQPPVIDTSTLAKRKACSPGQPNDLKRQKLDPTPFFLRNTSHPAASNTGKVSRLTPSSLDTSPHARNSLNPESPNVRGGHTSAIDKNPQAHPKIGSSWRHSDPAGWEMRNPPVLHVSAARSNQSVKLENKPGQEVKLQNHSNLGTSGSHPGSLEKARVAWVAGSKPSHGTAQLSSTHEPRRAEPIQKRGFDPYLPNRAQVLSKTHRLNPLGTKLASNTTSLARNASLSESPGKDISRVEPPTSLISPTHGVDTPLSPVPTVGSDIPDGLPSPRLGLFDNPAHRSVGTADQGSKVRQRSPLAMDGPAERTADPRVLSHGSTLQGTSRLQTPQKPDSKPRNQNEVGTTRSSWDGKFSMSKAAKKGNFSIRKCETPECTRRVWKAPRCEQCQQESKLEESHKAPENSTKLQERAVSKLELQHAASTILATTIAPPASEHRPTGTLVVPTRSDGNNGTTQARGPTQIREGGTMSSLLKCHRPDRLQLATNHNRGQQPELPTLDKSSLKQPATASIDDESPRSSDSGTGRPTTSASLDDQTTVTSVSSGYDSTRKALALKAQEEPPKASSAEHSSDVSRPQSAIPRSTCDECYRNHKKCLHDINGDLDPALCKAWFGAQQPIFRNSGRPVSEQMQIREAALRYTATSSTAHNEHEDEVATSRQDTGQTDKDLQGSNRNEGITVDPVIPKRADDNGFLSDSSDNQPIMVRRNAMRKLSSEKGKEAVVAPKHVTSSRVRFKGRKEVPSSIKGEAGGRVEAKEAALSPPKRRHAPGSGRLAANRGGLVTTAAETSPAAKDQARIRALVSRDIPRSPPSKVPAYTFISQFDLSPYGKKSKLRMSVEVPSRRPSPTREAAIVKAGPAPPAIDAVISKLKGSGVTFEEESSDGDMVDDSPSQPDAVTYPWQSVQTSKSLYDVAPMLRTPVATENSLNEFVDRPTRRKLSKKAHQQKLLHQQLRERREKHGVDHPHRMKESAGVETIIATTKLQDSTTQSWRDPLDPPVPEKVQMNFSDFMGMPTDPIFDDPETPRPGLKRELAFRDGKERAWIQGGATERIRKQVVDKRWLFMK